jgi:hypothetical protein
MRQVGWGKERNKSKSLSDAMQQTEREDADSTAGFTEEFVMPEQGGGETQVLSSKFSSAACRPFLDLRPDD